jgi:hypothetical protein
MATKKDIITCAGEGQSLLKCTGGKTESDFYTTFNMWGKGHSCYCKKCLDKIYEYYYKKSNENDKVALYYTLVQENTPFITDIYDKLKPKIGKVTPNKYFTEFAKMQAKQAIWGDFSASDFKLVENESFADEQMVKWEKNWGAQTIEGYKFLDETYEKYTKDIEKLTIAQKDLIKDLCQYRLMLRQINDGTYNGEMNQKDVQSQISSLLSKLKMDNFEEKKTGTLSEQSLFAINQMIEKTMPSDFYKDKKLYDDAKGRKKYYKDMCLRPLLNTLVDNKDWDLNIDDISQYDIGD